MHIIGKVLVKKENGWKIDRACFNFNLFFNPYTGKESSRRLFYFVCNPLIITVKL